MVKSAVDITECEVRRVASDAIAQRFCLNAQRLFEWGERYDVDWVGQGFLLAANDDWVWRDFLNNLRPNWLEIACQYAQAEIVRLKGREEFLKNNL